MVGYIISIEVKILALKWITGQKYNLFTYILNDVTPAQVAAAWIIAKGAWPTIGVIKVKQVEESVAAGQMALNASLFGKTG